VNHDDYEKDEWAAFDEGLPFREQYLDIEERRLHQKSWKYDNKKLCDLEDIQ
jgi:hypothetical protein